MANSRKSRPLNKTAVTVAHIFERALEAILARVVVSPQAGVYSDSLINKNSSSKNSSSKNSSEESSIAIAYSGGLDSAVLLRLAHDYCQRSGLRLFAFHIHHGLSPNADDWLAHCQAQAKALAITFDATRVRLNDVAGQGVEQAARQARYATLGELCRKHRVPLLLSAHHQDDQAETVLLQLMRGAGLRGLSGMPILSAHHVLLGEGVALGRPLLECTRVQLEHIAHDLSIEHISDESNLDVRYKRNAIRQHIAPVIERDFPGFAATVSRSSRHLQAAQGLLDELASIDCSQCAKGVALQLDRVAALSADRINNLLRYWLQQQGASQLPSEAQLDQLREQVLNARSDAHPELHLCGMRLQRQQGLLLATALMASASARGEPPVSNVNIQWRGESAIEVPEWHGRLVFAEGTGLERERLLHSSLQVRPRTGSERLKPDPTRPSRTLKNLFQESGVPASERPWLPLIYLGEDLVFAAGLGMDARGSQTETGVSLRWEALD